MGGPSGPRQLLWGHEPCVPQGSEGHPAAGPDGEPGDAAVVQAQPQPPLRGELQRPAGKIKITVCTTDSGASHAPRMQHGFSSNVVVSQARSRGLGAPPPANTNLQTK